MAQLSAQAVAILVAWRTTNYSTITIAGDHLRSPAIFDLP